MTCSFLIAGNAVPAIKELKQLPGKYMVLWGSISLVQSLIKENLVDEYHLQLCPVLTGAGRKLFPGEARMNQLQLQAVKQYDTGLVLLQYKAGIYMQDASVL